MNFSHALTGTGVARLYGAEFAILSLMDSILEAPRMVFCVKVRKELEGLAEVLFDGHPCGPAHLRKWVERRVKDGG